MNHIAFSQIITDLPDEIIEAAAAPSYGKPVLRYSLTAIAAGIVLLIAAAVYPKLRMQMPEVNEPPVITAETTVPVTTGSVPTATTFTQTVLTAAPATASAAETVYTVTVTEPVQTAATVTAIVYTTAETAPAETTAEQPETAPPDTGEPAAEPTQTELSAGTTASVQPQTEVLTVSDTLATEQQTVTVPVWKGRIAEASAYTAQTPADCQFSLCPQDVSDWYRMKYGIPADYDLTQHSCLLIEIRTGYTRMAVHGGELTADGLTLYIDRLDQYAENAYIRCSIPVPDGFTLLPEDCRAEYLTAENEAEYLENRIKQPTISIKK